MKSPNRCCPVGSRECSVVLPIRGRAVDVDFCIHDIVAALNANGIETMASCCGHGECDGRIDLSDGRIIRIDKMPR